ncbi:hypothetical protein TYRP_016223 [Tyrophagus putrescentiae]|nr:hypothetical protein TYRP_016223 [Tyrophagus putrescentiae]
MSSQEGSIIFVAASQQQAAAKFLEAFRLMKLQYTERGSNITAWLKASSLTSSLLEMEITDSRTMMSDFGAVAVGRRNQYSKRAARGLQLFDLGFVEDVGFRSQLKPMTIKFKT